LKKYYDSESIKSIDILYDNYHNLSEKYDYRDILNKVENKV